MNSEFIKLRYNQTRLTVVYKHHNNTIRLTIQHKAALTTCVYRYDYEVVSAALCCIVRRIVLL